MAPELHHRQCLQEGQSANGWMLGIISRTCMHCSKHTCSKFINSVAFLDERDQCRYPSFVIGATSEMRKDEFLKFIDLVLKTHQVHNGLITKEAFSLSAEGVIRRRLTLHWGP